MLDVAVTIRLEEQARAMGFDLCGVASAENYEDLHRLPEWLARGYAGEMAYLHNKRRQNLHNAMPCARSVIVCAMNYNSSPPYSTTALESHSIASGETGGTPRAWISRYAWGDDYHVVLKPKLDALVEWLRAEISHDFGARVYVDTGPVLERVAAKHAGLGWLAKNTCLINQRLGSWLFLGVILTDLDLAPTLASSQSPPPDLCGTCTRCIDACPTGAFPAPYVLDARRCISYLTIELRGSIPEELRPAMGSMVFGCDICQDVCPWNRKSPRTTLLEFLPREVNTTEAGEKQENCASEVASFFMPALEWLIFLTEDEFRRIFRASPVKRAKWRGLLRNACVAIGNARITPENRSHARVVQRLEDLARSNDTITAEHAAWALHRLRANFEVQVHRSEESDSAILDAQPTIRVQSDKLTDSAEDK